MEPHLFVVVLVLVVAVVVVVLVVLVVLLFPEKIRFWNVQWKLHEVTRLWEAQTQKPAWSLGQETSNVQPYEPQETGCVKNVSASLPIAKKSC